MVRRRKITPEILDEIVEHHKNGATVKEACQLTGMNVDTIYSYITDGKKAKSGKKRDFYLKMEEANAVFIQDIKERMIDSASPRALEFLLRATAPETYNISNKQEVKADVNNNFSLNLMFSSESIENLLNSSDDDKEIEENLYLLDTKENDKHD